ncbi:type III restriction protein res subunit [Mizugakiibacter sediminis]|uniref:Restriction endonuclease subunit R n=1 Tax=Mizugakiibacter sediminis TaxID=1475481 RepID=A0A0K8QK71_9GAMM|nr:DEAD/DEAH box helicase family protein [Mizugakiibacter sediminis]GAP65096.1 type III restriction protein res subunit [Mizugakiibacter sediminis]
MALELKKYQDDALGALDAFLAAARGQRTREDMQAAFDAARRAALGEHAPVLPYRPFSDEAPEIPIACLRVPTGGGKTLMAAHAIERAARGYVGSAAPLALWLVPSNAIRTQTLQALKTPGHPYREALLGYWPADRLTVLDIADCEQLRAQDFGSRAIVVVGTLQTLRVENTTGREVYAYKEAFEPHFATAPDADFFERVNERDLEAQPYLSRADLGKVKRSFANLLAWHRPIVIMDEAHNAQSALSVEVLKRIRPACVIEWTATPARDQNLLYHVSAQELKSEHMIKLPIVLAPHPNWREAVRDAVLTRQKLAEEAQAERDYLRPIVLFQADQRGSEVGVEVLKAHLMESLHIEERRIALATGSQRELDGVDLFDRNCPVDFVITVEALKEGWDCSFAYVFCTVQNIRSARDMEQLLGRVLRMPYAQRRQSEKLNRAYAHVVGAGTAQVANRLADRLVAMGFEEMEVAQFVRPSLDADLFAPRPATPRVVESVFELAPEAARAVAAVLPTHARVEEVGAVAQVTLSGPIAPEVIAQAVAAVPKREREQLERELERHRVRALVAAAPSERGEAFAPIPQLIVPLQGDLVLYEPELLAEFADFSLAELPADLPDFRRAESRHPYLIDVERGHLRIREDEAQYALDIDSASEGIRREDLMRALDRRLRSAAVLQPDMIAWLGRMLDGLAARGFELAYLARHFNDLADAAARRVADLLKGQRRAAFQQSLLPGSGQARLDAHFVFRFDPGNYPARWWYEHGRYEFRKHYYPVPGELKSDIDAEETACAVELDRLEQVKVWVRNLDRQPQASFWLPTSTDRFYPDFVAELTDGRLFAIEYKGEHLESNDDSREKRDIGKVWAAASNGRCVFAMVTDAATAGKSVKAQLLEAMGA